MDDEERDRMMFRLYAEVEILKSLCAVLSTAVLPDDTIDAMIEELDIPTLGFGEDETKILHAACERLAQKFSEHRRRKRLRGY